MLKKNKGSLTMGEFILIVGVLIAAFILFVYVRKFSFESAETARQSEVEGMARDIEEIGSRIYAESSFTSYLMDLPPMTKLSIRNGVLTVEKGKIKSSVLLPFIKDNITIENATRICIQKETDRVSIFADKCPNCNHDGDCEPEKGECEGCEDCRTPDGPSDECKGNERCDIEIGENCEITPEDCRCDEGYVCCPEAAHGDIGCTNDTDIPEGNPCFCDNQCIPGLKCNPTTPDFTDYNYACCPEGMAWNGTGCERYCDNDGTCEEWECFLDCEDCKNPDGTPSSICTNDHFCNPLIGENCETSGDCNCTSGVCCPEASDADTTTGCTPTFNLKEGEQCWCDDQCGNGLVCNPTAPGFTDYEKACCPEGKSWNGTECTEGMQVLIVALKSNLEEVYSDYEVQELENKIKEYQNALKDDGLTSVFLYLDEDETSDILGTKVTSTHDWQNIDGVLDQLIMKLQAKYLIIIGGHERFPQGYMGYIYSDDPFADYDKDGNYLPDVSVGRIPDPNNGDINVLLNALDTYIRLHRNGGLDLSDYHVSIMPWPWTTGECFYKNVFHSSCEESSMCTERPDCTLSEADGKEFFTLLLHGMNFVPQIFSCNDNWECRCPGWGSNSFTSEKMPSLDVKDSLWMIMNCYGGYIDYSTTRNSIVMMFLNRSGAVYVGSTNSNYGSKSYSYNCPVRGGDGCIGSLYYEIASRFSIGKRIGDAFREGKISYFNDGMYSCGPGKRYQMHINCLYGDPTLKIKRMWS